MNFPRTIARVAATGAAFASSVAVALAAVPTNVMPTSPTGAVGANSNIDFADIISFAATYLLSIAGGIAVLFLVIGGIFYITAGGSDEKVQKAKKYMQNAIVGLVVVLLAFVIVSNTLKITYSLEGGDEQGGTGLTALAVTPTTGNVTSAAPLTLVVTCQGVTTCPTLTPTVTPVGTGSASVSVSAGALNGATQSFVVVRTGLGTSMVTFSSGTIVSPAATVTAL